MDDLFVSSADTPPKKLEPAWWFVFKNHKMIVTEEGDCISIPFVKELSELGMQPVREWYLGRLAGHHCHCAEVSEQSSIPPSMVCRGLRYLYNHLEDSFHKIAMKAVHLIEWDKTYRYCNRCATEMARSNGMNAKECPACGFLNFPRISPAVIVLVEKEDKLLLARAKRFTADFYSVLAGFVEPGETLEETVRRELQEEVGIKVKNIRYFGSQPWPFPDALMIGFIAEHESGDIRTDESEIVNAGWFDADKLPTIPGKVSIARQLIDWFIDAKSKRDDISLSKPERSYDPNE